MSVHLQWLCWALQTLSQQSDLSYDHSVVHTRHRDELSTRGENLGTELTRGCWYHRRAFNKQFPLDVVL